jgi:AcrR family transcriptional regulator
MIGENGEVTSPATAGKTPAESLEIRPPLQTRSREAWTRVLDAGVALLEEGGYDAFTIAAVCDRAQVAPTAIYARADTKDAVFLAVYEHGMARVRADQAVLTDEARWSGLPPDQLARQAVGEVAGIFRRHAALLRSVVLISGVHPEVYRRGASYTQDLGDQFAALLRRVEAQIDQPDPDAAVRAAFNAVFSTLVLRTAYGPAFASPTADDESFLDTLGTMVQRYLFRG